jgi:hypothetical protein
MLRRMATRRDIPEDGIPQLILFPTDLLGP